MEKENPLILQHQMFTLYTLFYLNVFLDTLVNMGNFVSA